MAAPVGKKKSSLFQKVDTWVLVLVVAVVGVIVVGIAKAIIGTVIFAFEAAIFIVIVALGVRVAMAITGRTKREKKPRD